MSKRAFNKIMEGLDQARAYLGGTADKRRYRVHVPAKVDVKKIRKRRGLSQETLAATYGFARSPGLRFAPSRLRSLANRDSRPSPLRRFATWLSEEASSVPTCIFSGCAGLTLAGFMS